MLYMGTLQMLQYH